MSKYAQRRALNAAGVGHVDVCLLENGDDLPPDIEAVRLPAILKPDAGTGSDETHPIDSADGLWTQLRQLKRSRRMVLESRIPDVCHDR